MNNLLDIDFFKSIVLLCGNKECKSQKRVAKYKLSNKNNYNCLKCGRVMFQIIQGGRNGDKA